MITENNTLEMKNVLAYRCKVTQAQMKEKGMELDKYIRSIGAGAVGFPVTATYAVENGRDGQLIDMEFLIPLDRDISQEVSEGAKKNTFKKGMRFLPEFFLTNAVMIKHKGNQSKLQESIYELERYIKDKHYVPITVGYSVTVNQPGSMESLNEMAVDTYVGINPNIL